MTCGTERNTYRTWSRSSGAASGFGDRHGRWCGRAPPVAGAAAPRGLAPSGHGPWRRARGRGDQGAFALRTPWATASTLCSTMTRRGHPGPLLSAARGRSGCASAVLQTVPQSLPATGLLCSGAGAAWGTAAHRWGSAPSSCSMPPLASPRRTPCGRGPPDCGSRHAASSSMAEPDRRAWDARRRRSPAHRRGGLLPDRG